MASKEAPSFDDLTPITSSNDNDNDDVQTVKLDPGDDLVADVRHIEKNVGEYENSLLHLTRSSGELCKFWSNGTIDRRLAEAEIGPGDTIGIRKSEDEKTFTDDDGEETAYYPYEVAVLEGDD